MRFVRRSNSVIRRSGRSTASTNPGTPPPAPKSITDPEIPSTADTKARACSMTSSMGLSPKKPRRWEVPSASCNSSSTRSSFTRISMSGRLDHHDLSGRLDHHDLSGRLDDNPAIRVLARGGAHHTVFVVECVVDDLTVGRRHRLQRTCVAARANLARDLGSELSQCS